MSRKHGEKIHKTQAISAFELCARVLTNSDKYETFIYLQDLHDIFNDAILQVIIEEGKIREPNHD